MDSMGRGWNEDQSKNPLLWPFCLPRKLLDMPMRWVCPWLRGCTAKVHRELHPVLLCCSPWRKTFFPSHNGTIHRLSLLSCPESSSQNSLEDWHAPDNKVSHLERKEGQGVTRILVDAVTLEWSWLFLPVGLRLPSCAQGLPCCQNEERGWRRSSTHFGRRLRARLRGQRVESWDPSCNITHCGYSPTAQPGSTDLQQESEVSQVSDGQATPHILGCHVALLTPPTVAHVYQLSGPTLGFLGGSHYTTLSYHTLQD